MNEALPQRESVTGNVGPDPSGLLAQHERALSILCGLHPCVTIDGPPEEVALRIFDQVQAEHRALKQRIASLERTVFEQHRNAAQQQNRNTGDLTVKPASPGFPVQSAHRTARQAATRKDHD